jgi:hypothetical protein
MINHSVVISNKILGEGVYNIVIEFDELIPEGI